MEQYTPKHRRLKCGAKTRSGIPCKNKPMENGRWRFHGGHARRGVEHPNYKHGEYSKYNPQPRATKSRQRQNSIAVYLMKAENGLIKIGKAANVTSRLSAINTSSPISIELIHVIYNFVAGSIERELHTKFAAKRVKGEWFALTDEDIAFIKNKY